MIPKIIHYCWFGKKQKPAIFNTCYNSWKKFAPDYQIIEWNETNFEKLAKTNQFATDSFAAKKYAFCSDVMRLLILKKYGGIYFDIDVELVKPIDDLLKYDLFVGRDERGLVNTGSGIGSIPNCHALDVFLDEYKFFYTNNKQTDEVPCPTKNEKSIKSLGFSKINDCEIINNILVMPKEYMCPICYESNENNFDISKTISIHHYSGTWRSVRAKINFKLKKGEKLSMFEKLVYSLQLLYKKIKKR